MTKSYDDEVPDYVLRMAEAIATDTPLDFQDAVVPVEVQEILGPTEGTVLAVNERGEAGVLTTTSTRAPRRPNERATVRTAPRPAGGAVMYQLDIDTVRDDWTDDPGLTPAQFAALSALSDDDVLSALSDTCDRHEDQWFAWRDAIVGETTDRLLRKLNAGERG